jgi:excisionase family DNA binding protein
VSPSDFDPISYIENAFLDKKVEPKVPEGMELDLPDLQEYLTQIPRKAAKSNQKFRKTEMRAPRPRRAEEKTSSAAMDPAIQAVWRSLPKNVEFLIQYFNDSSVQNYYRGEFKESREELIRRLLDPELSLEDTSRLLGVVPATVRRYTNRGWLKCHRTTGGQRRFRLSDLVQFVEVHGRFPEE